MRSQATILPAVAFLSSKPNKAKISGQNIWPKEKKQAWYGVGVRHDSHVPPIICVLIPLYVSSHHYICVLIPLYVCPHTTIYMSSYHYMCPHNTLYVSWDVCDFVLTSGGKKEKKGAGRGNGTHTHVLEFCSAVDLHQTWGKKNIIQNIEYSYT